MVRLSISRMLQIVNNFVQRVTELFLKMTFLLMNTVVNQLHLLEINVQPKLKLISPHVAKTPLLDNLLALSTTICPSDMKVLRIFI